MRVVRWVGVGVVVVCGLVLWAERGAERDDGPVRAVVEGNQIASVGRLLRRLDEGGIYCERGERAVERRRSTGSEHGDCILDGYLEADVYVFDSPADLDRWLDDIPESDGVLEIDAVWGTNWLVSARTRSLLLWVQRLLGGVVNDPSYVT